MNPTPRPWRCAMPIRGVGSEAFGADYWRVPSVATLFEPTLCRFHALAWPDSLRLCVETTERFPPALEMRSTSWGRWSVAGRHTIATAVASLEAAVRCAAKHAWDEGVIIGQYIVVGAVWGFGRRAEAATAFV